MPCLPYKWLLADWRTRRPHSNDQQVKCSTVLNQSAKDWVTQFFSNLREKCTRTYAYCVQLCKNQLRISIAFAYHAIQLAIASNLIIVLPTRSCKPFSFNLQFNVPYGLSNSVESYECYWFIDTHVNVIERTRKTDLHTNGLQCNKLRICNDQKCAAIIIICILISWL